MTDKELAGALFNAGLLTQEQIREAAAARSAQQNFAQVVVARGWLSPDQIRAVSPMAIPVAPLSAESPFGPAIPPAAPPPPFIPQPPTAPPPTAPPPFPLPPMAQPPFPQAPYQQPPIPDPQAPVRFTRPTPPVIYEPFDSDRLLVYGVIGMLCCQCLAIYVLVMSIDGLMKVKAGRIDPSHQLKLIIAMVLSIVGVIATAAWRTMLRSERPPVSSSPF